MELSQQVISLELAKRLKELGVKQNGYFCYVQYGIVDDDNHEHIIGTLNCVVAAELHDHNASCIISSAFTVAELLESLPHRIITQENEPYNSFILTMKKRIWCKDSEFFALSHFYSVNYYCDTTSQNMDWMFTALTNNKVDENPANVLAKIRIYLLENGLIKND